MGHLNSYIAPIQPFQEKEKKFSTPGLPYVTSSQNYDISGMLIDHTKIIKNSSGHILIKY